MKLPVDQKISLSKPWWSEPEVIWLFVLVVAAYAFRVADLPLRGEEPTRVQIAREMVQSGDWIVPREQGEPFLSRPPLQNWLIALSCRAFDNWNSGAVRFPSVLATLLTTFLIYGYSRTFLSSVGSFAAAVAFATSGEMFQTGRLAETEAVFILFLSASLLVWHYGQIQGWPDVLTWLAGYGLMALAALTKGPQAPVYFITSISVYLVLAGQWRKLFSIGHLLGAAIGLLIIAAWLIPFYRQMGSAATWSIWAGDSAIRFRDWKVQEVVTHLLLYPLEIFGCTLPWSPLLLLYVSRRIRDSFRSTHPYILFPAVCLLVAFPTCWLPPGGVSRYFSPLYPCMAVLMGIVVDRCATADITPFLRVYWRGFMTMATALMFLAAVVAVSAISLAGHPKLDHFAEPVGIALAYAAVSIWLAIVVFRSRQAGDPLHVQAGVVALSCFMVFTFTGVLTDVRLRRSENAASAVKRLKLRLPTDPPLVSFGHVDSLFAYYYEQPIIPRPWPVTASDRHAVGTYFCFFNQGSGRPQLPFAWEEVAAISVDRNHQEPPETVVVVGRYGSPSLPLDLPSRTDKNACVVSRSQ